MRVAHIARDRGHLAGPQAAEGRHVATAEDHHLDHDIVFADVLVAGQLGALAAVEVRAVADRAIGLEQRLPFDAAISEKTPRLSMAYLRSSPVHSKASPSAGDRPASPGIPPCGNPGQKNLSLLKIYRVAEREIGHV